uniref:Uncharacterized protein n=1 Tax=Salix viminalis TaxID=40686 RepID=A0A6N2KVI5_SALVM
MRYGWSNNIDADNNKCQTRKYPRREAKKAASFSVKVIAKANRIQAQMSLIRAEDIATLPISVLMSFISARILASRGNAVTDGATPRKSEISWLKLFMTLCRGKEKARPMWKGRHAVWPDCYSADISASLCRGNILLTNALLRSITDDPIMTTRKTSIF